MPSIDAVIPDHVALPVPFGDVTVTVTYDVARWTPRFAALILPKLSNAALLADLVTDWDLTWDEHTEERWAHATEDDIGYVLDPKPVAGQRVQLDTEHISLLPQPVVNRIAESIAADVRDRGKAKPRG